MDIYYMIVAFIFGITLGSFYNVVGYRVPKKQSLIRPSSHCTTCNHKLGASELVPVFSYIVQGGKCKHCRSKISMFYPIFEFTTGVLFAYSYYIYGYSLDFLIAISFISMLLIIIISDYQMMIIPDEVLLFFSIIIFILQIINNGFQYALISLLNAFISFVIMFLLKKFGDFLFKKESMGGGDIKLLATFGLMFGYKMSIISIFMASFIALPIAVFYLIRCKGKKYIDDDEIPENSIPFGPFLAIAAIVIVIFKIDFTNVINIFIR